MLPKHWLTKNGTRIPNSAKNPPIPGPTINPVLIAADINPRAFGRSLSDVISAIYAEIAGMMHAPLIPPKILDRKRISRLLAIPNNNSEKLNKKDR